MVLIEQLQPYILLAYAFPLGVDWGCAFSTHSNLWHQIETDCLFECEVHKGTWYMLHYGGPSPKRHYALSNAAAVGKLWVGKLKDWSTKKKQLAAEGKSVRYVEKYIDKNGKKRWKGNRSLRSSECLGQ